MISQKWQRIILLLILAYEGWGGITGGTLLAFAPDGHVMKMPTDMLRGTFPNFLIPGLILTAMGVLSTVAFFEVLHKRSNGWLFAFLTMVGFIIWFGVEIIIVGTHWLQAMWGLPVVLGLFLVMPMIPKTAKKRFLRSF